MLVSPKLLKLEGISVFPSYSDKYERGGQKPDPQTFSCRSACCRWRWKRFSFFEDGWLRGIASSELHALQLLFCSHWSTTCQQSLLRKQNYLTWSCRVPGRDLALGTTRRSISLTSRAASIFTLMPDWEQRSDHAVLLRGLTSLCAERADNTKKNGASGIDFWFHSRLLQVTWLMCVHAFGLNLESSPISAPKQERHISHTRPRN